MLLFEVTFVLVVATGTFVAQVWSMECSVEEVEECIMDLRGSHSRLGKEVLPDFSDAQLNELCSFLEEAQPCILEVKEVCAANSTNSVKVLEVNQRVLEVNNGHDFICHPERKREYETIVRECAEEKEEELAVIEEKCHGIYHNMTWFLNKENPDNVHIFCKAAKRYLSCLREAVQPICGEEVAKWAKKFHASLWEAHLKHISCDPEGGMESGAIVIVSLCAGALAYCIICMIGGFLQENNCCKKMGKKASKDGKGEYMVQTQTTTDL